MQVILWNQITNPILVDQVYLEIELQILLFNLAIYYLFWGQGLSVPITGYQMKNFSPLSKKIYIDIDEHEIKKRGLKTKISIRSDLKLFLNQFNKFLKNKNQIIKIDWQKKLLKIKKLF